MEIIHPNELRIGNRVMHDKIRRIVTSIDRDPSLNERRYKIWFGHIEGKDDHTLVDFIYPIEINKEVLLSCGFEKQNSDEKEIYTIPLRRESPPYLMVERIGVFWYADCTDNLATLRGLFKIKLFGLHHIQNIYFMLSDNKHELEIDDEFSFNQINY